MRESYEKIGMILTTVIVGASIIAFILLAVSGTLQQMK